MAQRKTPKNPQGLQAVFLRQQRVGPAAQIGYQQDQKLKRDDLKATLKSSHEAGRKEGKRRLATRTGMSSGTYGAARTAFFARR